MVSSDRLSEVSTSLPEAAGAGAAAAPTRDQEEAHRTEDLLPFVVFVAWAASGAGGWRRRRRRAIVDGVVVENDAIAVLMATDDIIDRRRSHARRDGPTKVVNAEWQAGASAENG